LSVFATALAVALVTTPLSVPVAFADSLSWAPTHGHRHFRGHREFKRKARHREQHRRRHHEMRRMAQMSRPIHRHQRYRPPRRYHDPDVSISRTVGGAVVGALLGGLGGSQIGSGSGRTAAIVGGVTVGALLGGHVGRRMEVADEARVQHTLATARTGRTVMWQNPGNGYEVTSTRTYQTADRRDCREYTTWVFLGGYEEQVTGTVCRMPDGTWQRQAS
jgi:surface antigen